MAWASWRLKLVGNLAWDCDRRLNLALAMMLWRLLNLAWVVLQLVERLQHLLVLALDQHLLHLPLAHLVERLHLAGRLHLALTALAHGKLIMPLTTQLIGRLYDVALACVALAGRLACHHLLRLSMEQALDGCLLWLLWLGRFDAWLLPKDQSCLTMIASKPND